MIKPTFPAGVSASKMITYKRRFKLITWLKTLQFESVLLHHRCRLPPYDEHQQAPHAQLAIG